jgi:hypothetical protein
VHSNYAKACDTGNEGRNEKSTKNFTFYFEENKDTFSGSLSAPITFQLI